MSFVFLCHAREDAAAAFRLSESLKEAGFETWFDQERMLPGQHWPAETRRAIRQCDFFIALLSSRSLSKRGFVQRELKEALDVVQELPEFQTFLLPVRLDDCEVQNEVLQGIQWVDLFPSWDLGVTRLLHTLKRQNHLPGPRSAAVEPPAPSPLQPPPIQPPPLSDILRDVLAVSVLDRKNYVPRLFLGLSLLGVAMAATYILIEGFDIEGRNSRWEAPAGAGVSLFMITASYFLISGVSRWRLSYRARREIVRANEVVRELFAVRHPFLFRLILGSWYWRALLTTVQVVLSLFALFALLLVAVSFGLVFQGQWISAAVFLLLALGPAALVLFGFRSLGATWRSYQQKAGVPGV